MRDRRGYIKREKKNAHHEPVWIMLREQLLQSDKTEFDSRIHLLLTNNVN